jgi:hypothetical protein
MFKREKNSAHERSRARERKMFNIYIWDESQSIL